MFNFFNEELNKLKPHDHLCLIYDTYEERLSVSASFLAAGLRKHEKCIYFSSNHTREIVHHLSKKIDIDKTMKSGQLVLLESRRTYESKSFFDPDRIIEWLIIESDKALKEGYSALRVTGEMAWVPGDKVELEKLLEYEVD